MIHGILPVYKPKGFTSHDIVGRVRRWIGQKRVGHTGTLDPEVEGVLPICVGQATRVVEYIQDQPKRYRGTMRLGISTDTEDQTGTVLEQQTVSTVTSEQIQHVMKGFVGEIKQIPPMYSAVKVNGKRLYELARKGQVVSRKARNVTIYSLECIKVTTGDYPVISFDVCCSKGTYVRTLCVDIGKALGFPAHMQSLVRTESGPFHISDCFQLDELTEAKTPEIQRDFFFALDAGLGTIPSVVIADQEAEHVYNGLPLQVDEITLLPPLVRVYTDSGEFCAIYRVENGIAKPEKVFRDVND